MNNLIYFFKNAPLEEVTAKLKAYGVEFENIRRSEIMKLIIDEMELNDIRKISRNMTEFLKELGYGIDKFKEIRNTENKLTGINYKLYKIDR